MDIFSGYPPYWMPRGHSLLKAELSPDSLFRIDGGIVLPEYLAGGSEIFCENILSGDGTIRRQGDGIYGGYKKKARPGRRRDG